VSIPEEVFENVAFVSAAGRQVLENIEW